MASDKKLQFVFSYLAVLKKTSTPLCTLHPLLCSGKFDLFQSKIYEYIGEYVIEKSTSASEKTTKRTAELIVASVMPIFKATEWFDKTGSSEDGSLDKTEKEGLTLKDLSKEAAAVVSIIDDFNEFDDSEKKNLLVS
jgi:hypothetical protein